MLHRVSFHITNYNPMYTSIDQFSLDEFLECGGFLRWPQSESIQAHGVDSVEAGPLVKNWILWQGQSSQAPSFKRNNFEVFSSDFFLTERQVMRPIRWTRLTDSEIQAWLGQPTGMPPREWPALPEDHFQESFRAVKKQIQEGLLEKAVPVTFVESQGGLNRQEHLFLVQKLLKTPAQLHPYGQWKAGQGFLGATPEVLFEVAGLRLKTMALAATATLSRKDTDFLADGKERSEHHFVVRNMISVLQGFGRVEAMGPRVLNLPSLKHLQTEMVVHLNHETQWTEISTAMHPTSALGTYPREQWHWLKTLPGQMDRGSLGAPFGIQIGSDRLVGLVGIRQIQFNPEKVRIGAGCGLVKESLYEREWSEVLLKIESVKRNFGWN